MRKSILHRVLCKAVKQTQLKLRIRFAGVFAVVIIASGCSTTSKSVTEAPPPAPSVAIDQRQEAAKLPPPEIREVQLAVKRVFKESANLDTDNQPAFVTGDFNGDQSQDLAVLLKPDSARLADLNEQYPAWILRDLSGETESRSPRLRVAADEQLLAVIHGYGTNGWRDQQATQTYLLKNAAGSHMETQTASDLRTANRGRKLPGLRGDVLAEVRSGKLGYLYYSNASYSWYDPKTFTGEPQPRRTHGDRRPQVKN